MKWILALPNPSNQCKSVHSLKFRTAFGSPAVPPVLSGDRASVDEFSEVPTRIRRPFKGSLTLVTSLTSPPRKNFNPNSLMSLPAVCIL